MAMVFAKAFTGIISSGRVGLDDPAEIATKKYNTWIKNNEYSVAVEEVKVSAMVDVDGRHFYILTVFFRILSDSRYLE